MSRYLMIDVGAGTMDVLYYDDRSECCYKAVVRSPVQTIAETADALPGNLLLDGGEMGGGSITQVLKERAATSDVVMTAASANTLNHDPEKIQSWGILVVDTSEFEGYRQKGYSTLTLCDIEADRIERIIHGFGVPFSFDIIGICAQDHGIPPTGHSHLDYRHTLFKEKLDTAPYPDTLLYPSQRVPSTLNRLRSIAKSTVGLPAEEIYVMDSGMAAILGASMDDLARNRKRVLILDMATSHTLGAALEGDEIAGFFEYHTRDITRERIEDLLQGLANGEMNHETILAEGGHGAYIRKAIGFRNAEAIIATGPKRRLMLGSKLPISFGAPWGDNMMTGTVGLLEAVRRHKGLPSFRFI